MMRMSPNNLLANYPCSIVTICSAYSEIMRVDMEEALEKCLEVCERVEPAFKNIGYLSLKEFNKVVRGMLPVKRTSYYKRGERVSLKNSTSPVRLSSVCSVTIST